MFSTPFKGVQPVIRVYTTNIWKSRTEITIIPKHAATLAAGPRKHVYLFRRLWGEEHSQRVQSVKGQGGMSFLLLYFDAHLNNLPQCYVAFAVLCCIDSTLCIPTWLQDGSCTYTQDNWSTVGPLQSPRTKSLQQFTESELQLLQSIT